MSFFAANPLLIACALLGIAVVILLVLVIMMHLKLKKFLVAVNGDTISDSLTHVSTSLEELEKFRAELETYLAEVERRLRKSVQSVHTVRFNPFHGTGGGGNQSFATAFINEEGDGVVVSSLYAREHVSVFSKPVKKFAAEHELSDEEEQALKTARENLK